MGDINSLLGYGGIAKTVRGTAGKSRLESIRGYHIRAKARRRALNKAASRMRAYQRAHR